MNITEQRIATKLKDLKKQLRDQKALHKDYKKTAVASQKNYISLLKKAEEYCEKRVEQLQGELDEEKEYALDQLNDRAKVVAELTKRAVPEGWTVAAAIAKNQKTIIRIKPPNLWEVLIYPDNTPRCEAPSLVEGVKMAEDLHEQAKLAKKKKTKKARK